MQSEDRQAKGLGITCKPLPHGLLSISRGGQLLLEFPLYLSNGRLGLCKGSFCLQSSSAL